MFHFRELGGSGSGHVDNLADKIKDMNRTLRFCSDNVRYDLQRNLIRELEILCRRSPLSLSYRKAFKDVAEEMVEAYEGRGQVHVALKRVANNHNYETRENNIWSFGRLSSVFKKSAEADNFLIDRMMARRDLDGKLELTVWGEYVLDYLDKEKARSDGIDNISPDIC